MKSIVLASSSSGRRILLQKLGVPFTVIPSDIDEETIIHPDPVRMIQMRARAKAEDVKNKIIQLSHHSSPITHHLIIAADSMAILNNKTYGKPKDQEDARRMLGELMGETFDFVTHVVMMFLNHEKKKRHSERGINQVEESHTSQRLGGVRSLHASFGLGRDDNKKTNRWEQTVETKVTFRKMNKKDIDRYLLTYDVTSFAAGFAIDEAPWDLVTKIDGSYTNVIGLPFEVVLPIFLEIGLKSPSLTHSIFRGYNEV